jgi:hypothetical protein
VVLDDPSLSLGESGVTGIDRCIAVNTQFLISLLV